MRVREGPHPAQLTQIRDNLRATQTQRNDLTADLAAARIEAAAAAARAQALTEQTQRPPSSDAAQRRP